MVSSYQIKRNLKGHKILAVKGVLPVDSFENIKSEDFDVIYLVDYNQSHYELSVQLQNLSPFHSLKCHLKPRFLASTLKDRVKQLEVLIDGYASNLDDKEMNNRIDEIYEKKSKNFTHLCLRSRGIFLLLILQSRRVRNALYFAKDIWT